MSIQDLKSNSVIYLESDEDVKELLIFTKTDSLERASMVWHKLNGGEVVDHRESSEYTNCNAQRDVEFFQDVMEFDI